MCGIVAAFAPRPVSEELLFRAACSLRHRGPDALRYWQSADRQVGLAHTRLSIIDLVTGDQPIVNEDNTCRIVVNGEFYDYERQRRELTSRGHALSTRTDSEVALHLYEEKGVDCLSELRGEFAFVLWDDRRQALFAARDRFGIKPLFYTQWEGMLLIASEAKAFAAAGVRLQWDEEAMAQNIFTSPAVDRTLFANVFQVPPGHYLLATSQGVKIAAYWDLGYARDDALPGGRTGEEWAEGLRGELEEAVRLRMRADVPVGCLLSGGLDSSGMLAMARRCTTGTLKAFTVAFEDPAFDESGLAQKTAAEIGAEFHSVPVTNSDFAAVFSRSVWHGEGIHYNAHGAAHYLLSRAVNAAGIRVVLTGEGADEIAAGYRFCEHALGHEHPKPDAHWPKNLLRILQGDDRSPATIADALPALKARADALGFPEKAIFYATGRRIVAEGLLRTEFARRCQPDACLSFFSRYDIARQMDGRPLVKQGLFLWIKSILANYLLGGERIDMAHAVELRLPFLDHKLFEYIRDVPDNFLLRDGRDKWVLREAFRPLVPDAVYRRRKQPFHAPPTTLRAGSAMLALAEDTLRSSGMKDIPFFEPRAIVALLDRLKTLEDAERAPYDSTVLFLLSAALLHQQMIAHG